MRMGPATGFPARGPGSHLLHVQGHELPQRLVERFGHAHPERGWWGRSHAPKVSCWPGAAPAAAATGVLLVLPLGTQSLPRQGRWRRALLCACLRSACVLVRAVQPPLGRHEGGDGTQLSSWCLLRWRGRHQGTAGDGLKSRGPVAVEPAGGGRLVKKISALE